MRLLLLLAAVFSVSHGWIDWRDFRVAEEKMPSKQSTATANGWRPFIRNLSLNITWYGRDGDLSFLIAFDALGNCAGVRVSIPLSEVDISVAEYKNSGIFEEGSCNGKKCFQSTVLFADPDILKSGGRKTLNDDQVALSIYLKQNRRYKEVDRDGCEVTRDSFVEQGCRNGYGLVFSKFGVSSRCESLTPFYTIFDSKKTGNLMAFGWLLFGKPTASEATQKYFKPLPENMFKMLFPQAPPCLVARAQPGLPVLDVWLSHEAGQRSVCTEAAGSWVQRHCDTPSVTRRALR